jgi:2,4-dienoyl-CoA reductase-like NADH-dependent reductase (Old Yellow Enzyme family)
MSLQADALFEPLTFRRGAPMRNRFMLAPMTNQQSAEDGTLSDDELHWLSVRARGGFSYIVTCASHVNESGKGFPGALGCFSDQHIPGLRRIASSMRSAGALSGLQLYHGGLRSISSDRVGPSEDSATSARSMSEEEIEVVIDDFVVAALRAQTAGFDGAQLHAAHGYLISQFLSPTFNRRSDDWGGTPSGRSRFLFEIVRRIRKAAKSDFQLGVRISPERFGQDLGEVIEVVTQLLESGDIDYVDLSLWDIEKEPEDHRYAGRTLLSYFSTLPRHGTRLGVAGKIIQPKQALAALEAGVDFVSLGKVAVIHHDYPARLKANHSFTPDWLPISRDRLRQEGLGPKFIEYLSTWTNFVSDASPPTDAPRFDIGEYLAKGSSGKS